MATTKKLRRFKRLPTGPSGGIQLMLIQSVDQLGNQGDVVEVKRGYAMNYLLPQRPMRLILLDSKERGIMVRMLHHLKVELRLLVFVV